MLLMQRQLVGFSVAILLLGLLVLVMWRRIQARLKEHVSASKVIIDSKQTALPDTSLLVCAFRKSGCVSGLVTLQGILFVF